MRFPFLVALVLSAAGCAIDSPISDFAVAPPGCRAPSKVFTMSCTCTANFELAVSVSPEGCLVCDPAKQDCTTAESATTQCVEAAQECVGETGVECRGANARCISGGKADGGGDAHALCEKGTIPHVVFVPESTPDAGPTNSSRCPLADDVCCFLPTTATADMSAVVDMSVSVDQSVGN